MRRGEGLSGRPDVALEGLAGGSPMIMLHEGWRFDELSSQGLPTHL